MLKEIIKEARFDAYCSTIQPYNNERNIYIGFDRVKQVVTDWLYRRVTFNLILYAWDWVRALPCRFIGHDVECVNSWHSPNTGGEEFACRRCGKGWSITYY